MSSILHTLLADFLSLPISHKSMLNVLYLNQYWYLQIYTYRLLFNGNQSICHYLPQSRKYIPSSLIALYSILHTQLADLLPLPLAINPRAMCCTSHKSDTYQFTTIVFFFNGNWSICHYLPQSRKCIPSSLIVVSSILHTQKADWLPCYH